MADSTITREPEISAREVAAIPPDDIPAIQQALKRAFAAEDVAAKNIALKRASESIGLLSGYAPFPCEALMEGSYSAVFRLIRESLEAGAPGLVAATKDALARSGALKVAGRKLAPAAYGDKRQPYHSGACIGIVGMSVNLRFSDNSAEFVFHEEDLELVNEEGRDLYFIHFPASEVLALRQSLIDYLPASEAEISAGHGVAPPVSVNVPAPDSEERLFWLEAAEQYGFESTSGEEELPAFGPPAYFATEDKVLKLMAAAREQGRKDVINALATGGSAEQDPPVQWGDPRTVAGLIAQLRTLPPDAPIYGTFHGPDFPGEGHRRTGVRGVTLSREYVKGRWLSRDADAELQHVIWTKPASPDLESEEIAALTAGATR